MIAFLCLYCKKYMYTKLKEGRKHLRFSFHLNKTMADLMSRRASGSASDTQAIAGQHFGLQSGRSY